MWSKSSAGILASLLLLGACQNPSQEDEKILQAPQVGVFGYFTPSPMPVPTGVKPADVPRDISPALYIPAQAADTLDLAQMTVTSSLVRMMVGQEKTVKDKINIPLLIKPNLEETVVWLSGNPEVVSVHPKTGLLKALKPGNAVISVSIAGQLPSELLKSGQFPVQVIATGPVRAIRLTPQDFSLGVGKSQSITADLELANGQKSSDVQWTLAQPDLAALEVNSTTPNQVTLKALKAGKTILYAAYGTDPRYKAYLRLEVTP